MKKERIRSVTSINQMGTKSFTVGVDGVKSIRNNSIEYSDNIHVQFDAFDKDGKIIGSFMNGALAIDYFKTGEDEKLF